MRIYKVEFEKFEGVVLFAPNLQEAELLVEIYLAFHGVENVAYNLRCVNSKQFTSLKFELLQKAATSNAVGCGVYSRQNGWKIVPLWLHPPTSNSRREKVN